MAYYDYIRVYGMSSSPLEVFQGLGAAAMYNKSDDHPASGGEAPATTEAGGGTAPEAEKFPEPLWNAQTEVINRQSDFLMTISGTYAEKLKELPQQPGWGSVLIDSVIEWSVGLIGEWAVGLVDDIAENAARLNVVRQIVSFFTEFAFNAWEYIKDYYNHTGLLCMQMKAENDALCALPNTRENYILRTATIQQHEATSKNLIELIDALEQELHKTIQPLPQVTALVQAINDLRFNGASLQFPDGHVFSMVGGVVSQETEES